jgi:hypothetical protein
VPAVGVVVAADGLNVADGVADGLTLGAGVGVVVGADEAVGVDDGVDEVVAAVEVDGFGDVFDDLAGLSWWDE